MNSNANGWIDEAVARYERPLIAYAARLLHHDLDRARDVVQHAFLQLCKQDSRDVETHGVRSHLAEWLFAVVRNRAADVRRKESRMKLLDTQTDPPDAANDPSIVIETKSDGATLLAMLDALPANQAEVIRLKFQHGLSYQQISSVTKLSVTNVGYLLHTGIKTLRERLRASPRRQEMR